MRLLGLFLAGLLVAAPADAAITLFGTAKVPTVDNNSSAGPTATFANPPVASMAANDFIVVLVCYQANTVTVTNSATGGQTWTAETAVVSTGSAPITCRPFDAIFNGTWSAAPAFTVTSGTNAIGAYMTVWRGVDTTTPYDVLVAGTTYAAPSSPFNVANAGVTTLTANAVAAYFWTSEDNNAWTIQSGGPTLTQPETQWRANTGTGLSISFGYVTIASPGASGSKTNQQTALGGDAGITFILSLLISGGGGTTTTSTTTAGTTTTTAPLTQGMQDLWFQSREGGHDVQDGMLAYRESGAGPEPRMVRVGD